MTCNIDLNTYGLNFYLGLLDLFKTEIFGGGLK